MEPQTYPPASRTFRFSRLLPDSPHHFSLNKRVPEEMAQGLGRLVAVVLALLLLPMGQGELFAQQAPYYGQYAPYQQSGYMQPQPYGQQPSYAQQPYARSYPQQPYQPSSQAYPQQTYGQAQPPPQPLNLQQLEQLVAPIALYPDTLIAQMLTASTYPLPVVAADRWRQSQGYVSSDQIAAGANQQPWDPSVKAMTAFPQVLAEMDKNLQWTTDLGNAYYNQPQEIFAAVQIMRQRAQAAGNLQNTPQEAVSYNQGNIMLAPANPQMVYVPSYNPWTAYGQPVSPYPGFSLLDTLGSFFGSSPVQFGLGIAMNAFSHMSWGWLGWGLNWLAHSVLFNQSDYYSQSNTVADWGLPLGGPRAFSPGGRIAAQAIGSYGRPGGYIGEGFTRTPYRYPYGGNRPAEGYNRGYQTPLGAGYFRSPQEGFNRAQPMGNRPQQYGSSYGSSFYGRPGATYGSPLQAYHAPAANMQRGDFGRRSSNASMNRNFAKSYGKPPHSGGFHLFGGSHAPKGFGGGKSFSGHSGGGGHGGGGHGGSRHHFL